MQHDGAGSGGGGGGALGGWGSYYRQVTGSVDPSSSSSASSEAARQPSGGGGRRQKFAGFLKTANELRQSYYQGYASRSTAVGEREMDDFTGDQPTSSWPEVEVMRSGDEELVLFPSYARRRPERRRPRSAPERFREDEYALHEEDNNIVDVDVRGWLFAPHSGPLTRKNRYLHWVALKLCGLPAQALPQQGEPDRNPTAAEAESTKETATAIERNGRPPSLYSIDDRLDELERAPSVPQGVAAAAVRRLSWRPSMTPVAEPLQLPPQQPQLTPAEIASAHIALNSRLAPFMHRPVPGTPVTVFFFNAKTSQSRTLVTSDTGHFSIRVALPFIPTNVRVLASETLSATEEVIVHEPGGISLISDIDDTVKHSAVSLGAREIFRNTFTAPLSTLGVPGVAGWYSRLAAAPYNINFHYVSNSPWQLYPVLKSFFEEAGLPSGSMHLKQYSGMLQGIFEPVAERKKGTVERVIKDFPERRWVLVGDSGEADLEVYTEVVEKFPGRILAVFIRDVTTTPMPDEKPFFESNEARGEYERMMQEWADLKAASVRESQSEVKVPPPLPPKRRPVEQQSQARLDPGNRELSAASTTSTGSKKTPPPPRPKPQSLQGLQRTNTSPAAMPMFIPGPRPSSTSSSIRPPPPPSPPPPKLPRRTATVDGGPLAPPSSSIPVPTTTSPFPPPPSPSPSVSLGLGLGQGLSSTASSPGPQQGQLPQEPLLSKREELWNRRWERAMGVMERHGVMLKSWRVGGDVEVVCRGVVEGGLWGK